MAPPRKIELVRCYLSTANLPYAYVTQEGYGRTAEEARVHACWETTAVPGEEVSRVFVNNQPAWNDKDSSRIAHEICNWALDDKSDTPPAKRTALLGLMKRRMYADAIDFFYKSIQDEA